MCPRLESNLNVGASGLLDDTTRAALGHVMFFSVLLHLWLQKWSVKFHFLVNYPFKVIHILIFCFFQSYAMGAYIYVRWREEEKGGRRPKGACVKNASAGSYLLSVSECVFGCVLQAHGTVFEEKGVCSPQLFSSLLLWEVGGGWENGLLTASPSASEQQSALCHGAAARMGGKEWEPITASPIPPPPPPPPLWLWTSLTVPASTSLAWVSLSNPSAHGTAPLSRASLPLSPSPSGSALWSLQSLFVSVSDSLADGSCPAGATKRLWDVVVREALGGGGESGPRGECDERGLLGVAGFIWRNSMSALCTVWFVFAGVSNVLRRFLTL